MGNEQVEIVALGIDGIGTDGATWCGIFMVEGKREFRSGDLETLFLERQASAGVIDDRTYVEKSFRTDLTYELIVVDDNTGMARVFELTHKDDEPVDYYHRDGGRKSGRITVLRRAEFAAKLDADGTMILTIVDVKDADDEGCLVH